MASRRFGDGATHSSPAILWNSGIGMSIVTGSGRRKKPTGVCVARATPSTCLAVVFFVTHPRVPVREQTVASVSSGPGSLRCPSSRTLATPARPGASKDSDYDSEH